LRWIKEFWATRPHAYSHSRHGRYPGVSGSPEERTFGQSRVYEYAA